MNLKDATTVLGKCSAFDNRQPTQATALAWSEALADMPVRDALDFVTTHYASSREWIMPSDLNRAWVELKRARLSAVPQAQRPLPPQDADATEFLTFQKAVTSGISRGLPLPDVNRAAYAAIGRTPELEAPTNHYEINTNQIGKRA